MKLSKLKLWNYRCFGSEEQVILIDQLTTFIGNNSAGKPLKFSYQEYALLQRKVEKLQNVIMILKAVDCLSERS